MRVLCTMAFGKSQNESLLKNLCATSFSDGESNSTSNDGHIRKNEHLPFAYRKKQDEFVSLSKKSSDGALCCNMSDRKLNDFVDCNICERNDDINQSSDSLSSSASISDSDLTSTDSDDSLALSESESITDVTPLNSPYCDSPLPPNRHIEYKSDDKSFQNPCRNAECDASGDNCKRPETNVLMKAIEKLELEAKNNSEFGFRENLMRRRAASFSNEEAKRIEQENQRLFKRVISQQNRMRSIYSAANLPSSKNIPCRHQDLGKCDGDVSGTPKKSVAGKSVKEGDKSQARRKQKCLSHPSSLKYPCPHLMEKSLLGDNLSSECSGKKKQNISGIKIPCSQKVEKSCNKTVANHVETQ